MASHWAVKIVVMIACVVGLGVLGAGIGIPAAVLGSGASNPWRLSDGVLFGSMLVFGILGAALGGYVGNKIIRSKFK